MGVVVALRSSFVLSLVVLSGRTRDQALEDVLSLRVSSLLVETDTEFAVCEGADDQLSVSSLGGSPPVWLGDSCATES